MRTGRFLGIPDLHLHGSAAPSVPMGGVPESTLPASDVPSIFVRIRARVTAVGLAGVSVSLVSLPGVLQLGNAPRVPQSYPKDSLDKPEARDQP